MVSKQLNTRKILVIFPKTFRMEEALEIVKQWNPDNIDYDVINSNPIVYARKQSKFTASVTKYINEGIEFQTSNFRVPKLTNPVTRPTEEIEDLKIQIILLKQELSVLKNQFENIGK